MVDPEAVLQDFQIDNCRVCFDIKEWKRKAEKSAFKDKKGSATTAAAATAGSIIFTSAVKANKPVISTDTYKDCPPDALELGRSTWTFLHTMSAYYPDRPSAQQQSDMRSFLQLFSQFYPCGYCASHLRDEMQRDPPVVESRWGLSQWMCRMHNEVNERLGKPLFDCNRVDERWKDGPSDGSCG